MYSNIKYIHVFLKWDTTLSLIICAIHGIILLHYFRFYPSAVLSCVFKSPFGHRSSFILKKIT